jgi:hypothetical protein
MKQSHIARRAVALAIAVTAVWSTSASAAVVTPAPVAPLDTCEHHALSQPFTAFKDFHNYTLAPDGTYDSADTSGWALTGGASIVQTAQRDGDTGGVLDLPSNAQATSPVQCITSDYPTARLSVRNLAGAEGVFFYVSYFKNGVWTAPKNTGQFHGDHSDWTLSKPMNVQPSGTPGWQQVRFTLVAGGTKSRFQVDDFWVDPRASW